MKAKKDFLFKSEIRMHLRGYLYGICLLLIHYGNYEIPNRPRNFWFKIIEFTIPMLRRFSLLDIRIGNAVIGGKLFYEFRVILSGVRIINIWKLKEENYGNNY